MCHNSQMFLKRFLIRSAYGLVLLLGIGATLSVGLILQSKTYVFSNASTPTENQEVITPFPVSVNAFTKVIEEDPVTEKYFYDNLAQAPNSADKWWNKIAEVFSKHEWYQNLASPVSRILVIWPGERKEEVIKNLGDILGWNQDERLEFQQLTDDDLPAMTEGKYFPSQYVAHRGATPQEIHQLISASFETEVLSRYTPAVAAKVPLEDALIIASLLEREASDFTNMREVSGVIWNRLFIKMPLQLDATLQYVKGSDTKETKWWPVVKPSDKFLDSEYNTYQNNGLPPTPIAEPSSEAILAALNPIITDCLYYFHDKDGNYHCSKTYEEHVSKIKAIYGRGS
ncbi:MAG: hypothetical protein RLZZ230_668 [Candidatus Parcubacteria bacterium]